MSRFCGLWRAYSSGRSSTGSRGLRARAKHTKHAGMLGWPGGDEWSEGSCVARGKGLGCSYARGGMGMLASWVSSRGGMG